MPEELRLRRVEPADEVELRAIFAASRSEQFDAAELTSEALRTILDIQFEAQRRHYAHHYPDAEYLVLLNATTPAGRLIIERHRDELLLVDILVDPSWRGRGLGTWALHHVVAEARGLGLPVRCHVDPTNPARRLYERLGFVVIGQDGVDLRLELV